VTQTFIPSIPIWCAGCGDYAVRSSLERTLHQLGVPPHETMILAGIGCSGTIQNTIRAYGFHALHGRVLPTATGVALANPALTVVAAGGDGDGYAIGAGHLVHTFRRNPPLTYLLMNNGTYGLTKGQASPTTSLLDEGAVDGFDGIMTGLAITATTFLARAYCGWVEQLDRLMAAALEHAAARRGFAFLEVVSPCVTYQDVYPTIERRLLDLDTDPAADATDRGTAFVRCLEASRLGRIPVGLVYRDPSNPERDSVAAPAHSDVDPSHHLGTYAEIMAAHRV
jgi:2-oxoglutarate ferredoxin oxidoreductase subunit beta